MDLKKRLILAVSLITLALLLGACGNEEFVNISTGQMVITGSGVAGAEPDLAVIIAGIDLTLEDPVEVVDSAALDAESFVQAARDMGLADEDMQTSYYNLWVENVYDPYTYEYTDEVVYHVQHYIRFEVRNIDEVGDVLAAIISAGANTVSSISFTVEDQSELSNNAYLAAIEDAQHRAGMMADAMGVTLGDVQYISQYSNAYQTSSYSSYDYASLAGSFSVSPPPITAGAFMMSAQVSVTYTIE